MKPKDHTWLRCSIYLEQQYWDKFLNKGLIDFFKSLNKGIETHDYYLECNFDQGANIRLALQVETIEAIGSAAFTDTFFCQWLSRFKPKTPSMTTSQEQLFMNFASATMQYGLFDHSDVIQVPGFLTISNSITQAMVDAFPSKITDEQLITYAFHLKVCWLVALNATLDYKINSEFLNRKISSGLAYSSRLSPEQTTSFANIYKDSEDFFESEYKSIRKGSAALLSRKGIIQWQTTCEHLISVALKHEDKLNGIFQIDNLVNARILQQSGLYGEIGQLTDYIVFQLLNPHSHMESAK